MTEVIAQALNTVRAGRCQSDMLHDRRPAATADRTNIRGQASTWLVVEVRQPGRLWRCQSTQTFKSKLTWNPSADDPSADGDRWSTRSRDDCAAGAKKSDDMLSRYDAAHECDGQTYGWTEGRRNRHTIAWNTLAYCCKVANIIQKSKYKFRR